MIALSDTLRVSDYDDKQYTIERKNVSTTGKNIGTVTWTPVAYCGTIKGLMSRAREIYGAEVAEEARKAAYKAYEVARFDDIFRELPPKKPGEKLIEEAQG